MTAGPFFLGTLDGALRLTRLRDPGRVALVFLVFTFVEAAAGFIGVGKGMTDTVVGTADGAAVLVVGFGRSWAGRAGSLSRDAIEAEAGSGTGDDDLSFAELSAVAFDEPSPTTTNGAQ